jgi:hypothetical protein
MNQAWVSRRKARWSGASICTMVRTPGWPSAMLRSAARLVSVIGPSPLWNSSARRPASMTSAWRETSQNGR